MVVHTHLRSGLLAVSASMLLSACGIEAFFNDWAGGTNEPPKTAVSGAIDPALGDVEIYQSGGETVEPLDYTVDGSSYVLDLPSAEYINVRIRPRQGNLILGTFIPMLSPMSETTGVDIDAGSLTMTMIVDARLSAAGQSLQTLGPNELATLIDVVNTELADDPEAQTLRGMVDRLIAAGDINGQEPYMFEIPQYDASYEVVRSAVNADWFVGVEVDIDGDGTVDTGTTSIGIFDRQLGIAASGEIPICLDEENIRVVFEVDFTEGRPDGNCAPTGFKWLTDKENTNKSMYFVGGIHEESIIQDTEVDSMLGNPGSWSPNTVPMFDDGSNGDEVAGDNIWTRSFVLPRGYCRKECASDADCSGVTCLIGEHEKAGTKGFCNMPPAAGEGRCVNKSECTTAGDICTGMRMGYKYTWGIQGSLWTGTEEWPGNQHILELLDMNEDNYIRRRDNFADEASNKDLVNLRTPVNGGRGSVSWHDDYDGSGIPNAREQMIDSDNDCIRDDWVTPTAIGPATVACQ